MKKGFRSSVFGAVVGLVLVGSGVALGQSDVGPIDGGASTSLTLGEFLRTHKRVELAIPALDRLSLGVRPDLVLEDGTVFSVGNGSDSGCRAPLRIDGGSASGKCSFRVDRHDGKGPVSLEFAFLIRATPTAEGRLIYDLERICAGKTCLQDSGLCWQKGHDEETRDCTLRPIYEKPSRATPARLREFISKVRDGRFELIHEHQGRKLVFIELYPDRSFYVRDRDNSMFPCGGTWHVEGLHIRGKCDNEKRELEGSFDLVVNGVAAEGITFDAHLCVPGPADCGDESGGFWLPHGRRDTPGGRVVELIQGSRDSELLKVAELRLRGAFWDEWRDAVGLRLPVLVRGPPARHPRVETQIFFSAGEDAKRLAGVTARLLGPVVGVVEPRPWPGSSASAVVVVVGERVVVGGSRAE